MKVELASLEQPAILLWPVARLMFDKMRISRCTIWVIHERIALRYLDSHLFRCTTVRHVVYPHAHLSAAIAGAKQS
jgi:hypothetical protein